MSHLLDLVVQGHFCSICSLMNISVRHKDLPAPKGYPHASFPHLFVQYCPFQAPNLSANSLTISQEFIYIFTSGNFSWATKLNGQVYYSRLYPLREFSLTTIIQSHLSVVRVQQQPILNQPSCDPGLETFFLHHLVIANSLKP